MATIHYSANSYAGEVLENLLVYTMQGNDTYAEGLIHIKPGIQHKLTLPHVGLGKIIQDNVATPTSTHGGESNGFNQYTFTERYLEPQDFMVYLEFNPRDFEDYWKPFQPDGQLIFRELDPKVQSKMLELLVDKKDQYIGESIWCSRKGGATPADQSQIISDSLDNVQIGGESEAGPMKYFDGFIARVLKNLAAETNSNEAATGRVVLAGSTVLDTGAKVESALYTMWQACPKKLRKSNKLCFVMGWELWDLYDQYLSSKDHKYTENTDVNRYRFRGKRVVVISDIPENTIALGKFTSGEDSCLWMGVDYATDQESVKVEKLQANSELYFFQMRMKVDVNIVLPSEIVVWTTYKYKVAVSSVTLNKESTSIAVGANETLLATIAPEDASIQDVVWASSDTSKATVDQTGKVVGVAAGSANITATVDGKTATCAVTVTE